MNGAEFEPHRLLPFESQSSSSEAVEFTRTQQNADNRSTTMELVEDNNPKFPGHTTALLSDPFPSKQRR